MSDAGLLRIGELSRRAGVSPELLRAWERRYGLLSPTRSAGGLRLYAPADVERVRAMQAHLSAGLAAAEAAELARRPAGGAPGARSEPELARGDLAHALEAFDEPRAQAAFDAALGATTLDSLLTGVLLPYLHELGERWQRGEITVAQEHFASGVIRGRLAALGRDWGRGLGPPVILACAPGEQHDLGLIAFGLALRARGWRIGYLGADTPVASMEDAAKAFEPRFVVVSAVAAARFAASGSELRRLARRHRLCVGGAGAADGDVARAVVLSGDPVSEAERLTDLAR